jgi:hypothetical protein
MVFSKMWKIGAIDPSKKELTIHYWEKAHGVGMKTFGATTSAKP